MPTHIIPIVASRIGIALAAQQRHLSKPLQTKTEQEILGRIGFACTEDPTQGQLERDAADQAAQSF